MSYRVRGRVNLIKPNTLYLHVHADYVGPPLCGFSGGSKSCSLYFLGVPAVQVRSLYTMMKYDIQNPKRAAYMDAWHLRRLYTFSF